MKNSFLASLNRLKEHLETASAQGIDFNFSPDPMMAAYDFKTKRQQYVKDNVQTSLLDVKKRTAALMQQVTGTEQEQLAQDISVQVRFLDEFYKEPMKALDVILKITQLAGALKLPEEMRQKEFKAPRLPAEINVEVHADINELNKCFASGCHRSCVILCGRIIETALHRKYFEATGNDLLEKNPGIGLGNLIGKLKDKNVTFDPGITQQIHLINQVRIFSVHTKQEAFSPSKEQTQAIILYTLDVIGRLF